MGWTGGKDDGIAGQLVLLAQDGGRRGAARQKHAWCANSIRRRRKQRAYFSPCRFLSGHGSPSQWTLSPLVEGMRSVVVDRFSKYASYPHRMLARLTRQPLFKHVVNP